MSQARIRMQNVRAALSDLEESTAYTAFSDVAADEQFHDFRRGVEITGIRCLQLRPDDATPEEIQERLERLQTACDGPLAVFRPFIDRALDALREP